MARSRVDSEPSCSWRTWSRSSSTERSRSALAEHRTRARLNYPELSRSGGGSSTLVEKCRHRKGLGGVWQRPRVSGCSFQGNLTLTVSLGTR
jgi:hypothetical protein